MRKTYRKTPIIRYSHAFKMSIVREIEDEGLTYAEVMSKYGIRGKMTVKRWIGVYGGGKTGRIIRVEKPNEINELKKLRDRIKRLETALADSSIDLAIEKGYVKIACQRAGIADVEAFKKKADIAVPGKY
jgi:transposase-like protein